jgi:hypothetical protein
VTIRSFSWLLHQIQWRLCIKLSSHKTRGFM